MRAQAAQNTVSYCEPAPNVELHDGTDSSSNPRRWSYSYQSYDDQPDACECVVGGECRLCATRRGNNRRWGERREVLQGCARRLVLVCPYRQYTALYLA